MGVSNVIEEVDLVFWKEEGDGHRMYRCVTLSLSKGEKRMGGISWELRRRRLDQQGLPRNRIHRAFEVIYVSGVRFASPKPHVRDFHVTPI